MFEFHGWATIHADDSDDPAGDLMEDRERGIMAAVRDAIRRVEGANRDFRLNRLNGTAHLIFCGDHNHRDEAIIEFFKRLSKIAPHSYGKLHVRDDEDARGFENSMREWTMALGQVTESTDAQMSPCVPALEPEYNEANKPS
ncbi:Imm7 family immunity protein [Haloferula sp. A504]|uniref:Imm7 family immunity protein n=1 Tax=Haloferula sp. A504 TaxID=3373601 RepID=UPI0031C0AD41|nr:immunity 7 family protein [Verrucomicrobiaceae bacterium E54]